MAKKIIAVMLAVIVIALLLGTQDIAGAPSIEGALSKVNIPNAQVLYNLVTHHGTVVFFEASDNLNVGLLKKELFGWRLVDAGGGTGFAEKSGLSWNFVNIGGSGSDQIHLVLGTITNSKIVRVEVTTSGGLSQDAMIIETTKGRVFYILYAKPQNPPVEILGLSDKGNPIYKY